MSPQPPPQREVKKHGTGGYAYGCRCDVCRGATAAYRARKRAEQKPEPAPKPPEPEPDPQVRAEFHGTETGYAYGCRARCCREARAKALRGRRERNRARAAEVTTAPGGVGKRPGPGAASAPGVVRYVADLPEGVEHGSVSAYTYWACRCLTCTEAANRRLRESIRARSTRQEVEGR